MKKTLLTCLMITCAVIIGQSQTSFAAKQTINATTGDAPYNIASGFVDGDAYADIVIGTWLGNTIEWYKNNGDGTFTQQTDISTTTNGVGGIKLVDLNNDTYLDILATSYNDGELVWFKNDGAGNFSTKNVIATGLTGAGGLATGTIDVGTTVDVAVVAYGLNKVVWFANNGDETFNATENIIDNSLTEQGSVNLKDIDGDGDLDALIATAEWANGVIEIFRHDGGSPVTYTKDLISVDTGKTYMFFAAFEDIDGDTNLDILAVDLYGDASWYEDNGAGFTETIFTTSIANPSVMQYRDLDDDGNKDIILSSGTANAGNDLVWFRNLGGGTFGTETVIDATQSQAYVFAINDFDNDLDLDIASCSYNEDHLNWFENERYTLSTVSNELSELTIYPNPAKDRIYFKNTKLETINLKVYNVLGKEVMHSSLSTDESLDISNLNNGMYIITIAELNATYKFIKR